MTAQWVHPDWQLLDDADGPSLLGVSWGLGVLDEPLERTGVLGTALAALRDELARPVELGPGRTGMPEILVDLDTDTCALLIRGQIEVVRSAWSRMRTLFTPDIVGADTQEAAAPHLPWAADLAHRTGVTSAPLALMRARGTDVRARAGELLTHLDPSVGLIPRAFVTNREELVGLEYGSGPAPRGNAGAWPDGTPKPLLSEPPADPQRPGTIPDTDTAALCSFLVPRTSAGIAAAHLVQAQVQAAFGSSGVQAPQTGLSLQGLGTALLATVGSDPQPTDEFRYTILGALAQRLTLIPDAWLDDVASHDMGAWARRDAVVRGIADDVPASPDAVRRALADASATLHLGLEPSAEPAGDRILADFPPLFARPDRSAGTVFRAWRPDAPGDHYTLRTNLVRIGGDRLSCGIEVAQKGANAVSSFVMSRDDVVAVVEDAEGGVRLVDRHAGVMGLNVGLFRKRMRTRLDTALQGVERLSTAAAPASSADIAKWTRAPRRAIWGRLATPLLVVLVVAGLHYGPKIVDHIVNPVHALGDTVALDGGAQLTIDDAEVRDAGDGITGYQVRVEFCGGASGLAHDISPGEILMQLADGSVPMPVSTDGDLEESRVDTDECVTGTLTYGSGEPRQDFTLTYIDDGKQIVWDSSLAAS